MRHMSLTLVQSTFSYQSYPNDVQTITMSLFSFTLSNTQMQLVGFQNVPINQFTSQPALIFVNNPANGEIEFNMNPVWQYVDSSVEFSDTVLSPYNSMRSTITFYIKIKRRAAGAKLKSFVPCMYSFQIYVILITGIIFYI